VVFGKTSAREKDLFIQTHAFGHTEMSVRFSERLAGFEKVEKAIREMLCLTDYAERFRIEDMT